MTDVAELDDDETFGPLPIQIAAPDYLPDPKERSELAETDKFFRALATGAGQLHSALGVGWSPAKLRRKLKDPEFAELVGLADALMDEGVEQTLLQRAKAGNVTAIKMWLYNRQPGRWRDVRHIQVDGNTTLSVDVVVGVKQAALELIRERGVREMQPAPQAIEAEVVDAADR